MGSIAVSWAPLHYHRAPPGSTGHRLLPSVFSRVQRHPPGSSRVRQPPPVFACYRQSSPVSNGIHQAPAVFASLRRSSLVSNHLHRTSPPPFAAGSTKPDQTARGSAGFHQSSPVSDGELISSKGSVETEAPHLRPGNCVCSWACIECTHVDVATESDGTERGTVVCLSFVQIYWNAHRLLICVWSKITSSNYGSFIDWLEMFK